MNLYCGRDEQGRPCGSVAVCLPGEVLRRIGLHPDQPSSRIVGPSPPAWWHAAGERYARLRP
ncbi:hypothetical protein [Catellatospora sp. NPDC049609]|uniref:hypothetical protein n=1 Tax=Catellatospora sp. NPDC049609 TaxID=3155505 RepID=UPI00341CE12A